MERTRTRYRGTGGIRPKVFNLSAALPSDFTYVRNDTVATYRNSSGNLVQASANTPRFDHDIDGTPRGVLREGARTNKCTGYNLATATTNITAAGTGASLTIVDSTAALEAAGLSDISGGMCFRATSTGTGTFTIGGTAGALTLHAASVWARVVSGSGDLRLSGTSDTVEFSGSSFQRYTLLQVASNTSSAVRIVNDPGSVIEFLLFQYEEASFASSEIIVAGAAATREQDTITIANVNTKSYFNEEKGFLSCLYKTMFFAPPVQYILMLDDGTSSNTIGVRYSSSGDGYIRGYVNASGAKHTFQAQDRPMTDVYSNCFVTWKSGETIVGGNGAFDRRTYSGDPEGITTFRLGARYGNNDPFFGWIKTLCIGKTFDVYAAVKNLLLPEEFNVIAAGQSNIDNEFDVETAGTPLGKEAFISTIQGVLTDKVSRYGQGATGGTCLLKSSAGGGTNYWYNDIDGTFDGDAFRNWVIAFDALGRNVSAINWDQGEGDVGSLKTGAITIQDYSDGLVALFAEFRRRCGDVPISITMLGRRTDSYSAENEWQLLREFQQTITGLISDTHLAPEKFDLAMLDETGVSDGVHLADASYVTNAQRQARKDLEVLGLYSGAVDGPVITNVSRSSVTVTVTLTHASGTDIAPMMGIEGFVFTDDGTPISIIAAVRTNATTITLTLAGAPSGEEVLYYGYGVMSGVDNDNLVVDNSAFALPLRSYAGVLT